MTPSSRVVMSRPRQFLLRVLAEETRKKGRDATPALQKFLPCRPRLIAFIEESDVCADPDLLIKLCFGLQYYAQMLPNTIKPSRTCHACCVPSPCDHVLSLLMCIVLVVETCVLGISSSLEIFLASF